MTSQEDLDLLLSLEDRVLETPPGSPSAASGNRSFSSSFGYHSRSDSLAAGYLTDDETPNGPVDLSDFRHIVQDCLDHPSKSLQQNGRSKSSKNINIADVEKFSGLRIRNQLLSPVEIVDRFSDIRFIRLPTIKNLLAGDKISGCWATMGVLTEKGNPKTSSIGQSYCIWKLNCLNESSVSLFLFGDAYKKYCKEKAGEVFGLFNCSIRKDNKGSGFSLSIASPNQILKMGTSSDYGVCKGKKKEGTACTSVINKRQGAFCKYHKSKASEKFATTRTELKGGNLRTAFRNPKLEGVYMVNPSADTTNLKKATQPVKVLTVEGLRKALSNAEKVTTVAHSQGIRFLNEMAVNSGSKNMNKESELLNWQRTPVDKRKLSTANQEPTNLKKKKIIQTEKNTKRNVPLEDKTEKSTEKMIELDFCSDEDSDF